MLQVIQNASNHQIGKLSNKNLRNLLNAAKITDPKAAIALRELQDPFAGQFYEQVDPSKQSLSFPNDNGFHLQYANDWYFVVAHLNAVDPNGDSSSPPRNFYMVWVLKTTPTVAKDHVYKTEDTLSGITVLGTQFSIYDTGTATMHQADPEGFFFRDPAYSQFSTDPFIAQVGNVNQKHILKSNQSGELLPATLTVTASYVGSQPMSVDLQLNSTTKTPLYQGDRGFVGSRALKLGYWYYSWPMLQISGSVKLGNETVSVTGQGWLDHQWGTIGLPKNFFIQNIIAIPSVFSRFTGSAGWNWFEFQGDQCETKDANSSTGTAEEIKYTWIFTGAYLNSFDSKGNITHAGDTKFVHEGQGTVWNPHSGIQEYIHGPGKMQFTVTEWIQSEDKDRVLWPRKWKIRVTLKDKSILLINASLLADNQVAVQPDGLLYMEAGASAEFLLNDQMIVQNALGFAEAVGYQNQFQQIKALLATAGISASNECASVIRNGQWKTMQMKGMITLGVFLIILIYIIAIIVWGVRSSRKKTKKTSAIGYFQQL